MKEKEFPRAEEYLDWGLYNLKNFGEGVNEYSLKYFILFEFHRYSQSSFVASSAIKHGEKDQSKIYDVTMLFSKELCFKILDLIHDKNLVNNLKKYFNGADQDSKGFIFKNILFIGVSAIIGEKIIHDGKEVAPLIATNVFRSPSSEQ